MRTDHWINRAASWLDRIFVPRNLLAHARDVHAARNGRTRAPFTSRLRRNPNTKGAS